MGSEDNPKVAEYFVVAGLTESSQPLEEDLAFPNANHKLSDQRKDPITDICVIDKTLEESCPPGFICIEHTPTGFPADLNHGSLTAHNLLLCYRRGKDKAPLIDLGVYYEGLETVRSGISILETTPTGRSANVNNKSGMGSHSIFLTFRRAKDSAPQNALVVTDICIILTNKGERAPYAFCQIEKNLNKGLIGSSVHLCYKKSMRQVDSIPYKAGMIGRYPSDDVGSFPLPSTVPLFCLPMGATIECWSSKTRHPLPTFSSFVLTTEKSEKVFGAVVSFYENYPDEKLTDEERYKLGLLRGDGMRSRTTKTIHTNKAICLLSRWPMFNAFRDFLMYLYKMTVSPMAHTVPVERHIAHFMHNVPFPTSQRPRVQYQMSPFHLTILTRPQITPIPLSGASFLALLDDLGPENTIALLVLALTEHKIVIHSLRPAEITCVAEALITLLFPFKWQCTYVPLCPLEMGYVMEAPCPFIVGVDSRYFDLYEPPPDVACVNLDTNSITIMEEKKHISWKLLPRKPAKLLRSTLTKYFKEVKEFPREESIGFSSPSMLDPDMTRTERHRRLELAIQEAVLKMMTALMKGYRQFLLPITEAPSVGTTDPTSLFNIQEFVRSREKSSQRFFTSVTGTQLFSSFIEERSLTSFIGGDGAAGLSSGLVFFDECVERLTPDYDSVKLIEADDSLKSEHTVMIMAPDETGLPPGVGYQYTTFPDLQDELFLLDDVDADQDQRSGSMARSRRKSDTFTFGRRTKQEVRTMQKLSKMHSGDSQLWARLLLSHTYGAWFACLPAFVLECRHKSAALRTAHDALHDLKEKRCTPLPDETYYRMLLHLCSVYNKPALAVRVFQFVRKTGTQLSAITYGLYNKAVLEGTWPASNRDGYMLWQKLRNVLLAMRKFKYAVRRRSGVLASSEASSDIDTISHTSVESSSLSQSIEKSTNDNRKRTTSSSKVSAKNDVNKTVLPPVKHEEDSHSTDAQSDHGYNSMPKDEIRRGSPLKGVKHYDVRDGASPARHLNVNSTKGAQLRANSSSTETTDSLMSSSDTSDVAACDSTKPVTLERSLSSRSVQPPTTLDIPPLNGVDEQVADPGLKSDETLVNGENWEPFLGIPVQHDKKDSSVDTSPHRPRSSPVSPGLHRKPGCSSTIVKSSSSGGGGSCGDGGECSPTGGHCSPECTDELAFSISNSSSIKPLPCIASTNNGSLQAVTINSDFIDDGFIQTADVHLSNLTSNNLKLRILNSDNLTVDYLLSNENSYTPINGLVSSHMTQHNPPNSIIPPLLEVIDYDTPTSTDQSAQDTSSTNHIRVPDVPATPLFSPGLVEDNVFSERKDAATPKCTSPSSVDEVSAAKSPTIETSNFLGSDLSETKNCHSLSHSSGSPATPELANLFGSDSKFLSSLSDSDQLRYQELCSHRPSSLDPEHLDSRRTTRHGSLIIASNYARVRSSSALFSSGGGISPLIGQKSFLGGSNPNTPTSRNNFDNITAEDLMTGGSPTHSIMGLRSGSGSILTSKNKSASRLLATSDSPVHRRSGRKIAGSNSLMVRDGVAMLTSTPLKPVIEPSHNGNEEDKDDASPLDATDDLFPDNNMTTPKSKPPRPTAKQDVVREDISHLAEDPLSTGSDDPITHSDPLLSPDPTPNVVIKSHPSSSSNSLSRHLVDEIEDHLQKDALIRCSSDATLITQQKERIAKSNENLKVQEAVSENKLHRKSSLPSHSPTLPRKIGTPPLQRSLTFDNTTSSSTWFGSGSKFNSLLKATTIGMASKAKKVATNLAKDLNETMQASLAYYTPEKVKGSLSDLSLRSSQEDILSKSPSSRKQLLQGDVGDLYSSQSSLRSIESIHSALDSKAANHDKVSRRAGGNKKSQRQERPLSMPQFDSSSVGNRFPPPLANSFLSVPGNNVSSSDPNITASMTSLNMKGTIDIEVTISSCSKCHKCGSLIYDEEIMAGWIADESNLNTHCPFCNSLFVPFLNIEITDYRSCDLRSSTNQFKSTLPPAPISEVSQEKSPKVETFQGSFTLPLTPDVTQTNPTQDEDLVDDTNTQTNEQAPPTLTPPPTPLINLDIDEAKAEVESSESIDSPTAKQAEETTKQATTEASDNVSESPSVDLSESHSSDSQLVQPTPTVLEPVTVPYLSSLVLRKELESLLENEGTIVLTEPDFIDHHPIIYWNLVWYFRRLNLHSNLYNLLLRAQLLQTGATLSPTGSVQSHPSKSNVMIYLMWDNLKLHESAEKPPLYYVWHQLATQGPNEEYQAYSSSFLSNIKDSIMQDDVRGPLVAVLSELNVQQGTRRSAYREILYLVLIALGKSSIDVDAFDREYKRAYDALTGAELALAKKCDRPPSDHAKDCRNIFGELDLYK